MKHLVHFQLKPDADRQEATNLIAPEQARLAELHRDGLVEAVYVAQDMQHGWIIFNTDDAGAVEQALQSLPLDTFLTTETIPVNVPAME